MKRVTLNWIVYLFICAVIGGFFAGWSTITNPDNTLSNSPFFYIPLSMIIFIPIVFSSIPYSYYLGKFNNRDFSPSYGMWIFAKVGCVLILFLWIDAFRVNGIINAQTMGLITFEQTMSQIYNIELTIIWCIRLYLVISCVGMPIFDIWHIKHVSGNTIKASYVKLFGLSCLYYISIYIGLFFVNLILFVILTFFMWGK